jgi:hypothetical protein
MGCLEVHVTIAMLKLFQSIFGGGERPGRYPETLVEAAIERTVDGTDPRIRVLPGYRKQLRDPVIHAVDHVVALVDNIPAPLAAGRDSYAAEPCLGAMFASADRMLEVFGHDTVLTEFRNRAGRASPVTALLLAERVEKNVFGMEMDGDLLRRDVAQVAVSFRGQRLVDPAGGEEKARRLLKRRAFDHLLSLALARIVDVREERADLKRQRQVLRNKQDALQSGGWGFDEVQGAGAESAPLQSELDDIEAQLATLQADADLLGAHLNITTDLLADAERQLWAEDIVLSLDRMNIRREAQDASAGTIRFQELHNARGRRLVMLLVTLTLEELPRREDFFTAAERYLR